MEKQIRDNSYHIENAYLKKVINRIDSENEKTKDVLTHISNINRNLMYEERSNLQITKQYESDIDDIITALDFERDIKNNNIRIDSLYKKQKILNKMKNSPYFGRFDFLENDSKEIESIYIGLSTLYDDNDILIYDWRSPVSGMFYDFENGPVYYFCPAGKIEGEILLKRQYKIENGKLIYYFDSTIKIDDEILKEVLSKNTDGKMKDIIKSIQKEQNRIIRNEEHKILIVYGPAGSGKTSVAMHRIAYLLYRYKDTIESDNIVIFSPNNIFSDYISTILPELGENNIKSESIDDYLDINELNDYVVEDKFDQIEFILNNKWANDRFLNIGFKTSLEFLKLLIYYADNIHLYVLKFFDIIHNEVVLFSKEDMEKLYLEDFSLVYSFKRLYRIKKKIQNCIKPYEKKIKKELKEKLINDLKESEDYMFKKEFAITVNNMFQKEMASVYESIAKITYPNIIDIYIKLFENLLSENIKLSNISKDVIKKISTYTIDSLKNNTIPNEDIVAITYLKNILNGFNHNHIVKHVIIDEGQDYSPLQIELIKNTFSTSKITILGDVNQQINQLASSYTPENIASLLNKNECNIIRLSKSYRSTAEISIFCSGILNNNIEFDFFNRKGDSPTITKFNSYSNLLSALKNSIVSESYKYKSIAIITKTADSAKNVYENVDMSINLVKKDDIVYKKGISVIPSYLAKGLEFDYVIVICNNTDYQQEFERNLFYSVCSRALHKLDIFCINDLPIFIKNISKNFYITSKRTLFK